jgi:CheY-like chemotaxis protein
MLETRRVRFAPDHQRTHGWGPPGEYVCLSVRDTGVGMDESTRARAFDPFFTTKQPGAGSGLGLAMVYGLVKQQNGFVSIESEPGGGTVVRAYFPVTHRRPAPTPPAPLAAALPRTPTVLVVDDEEQIRRAAKRALEHYGFTVLVASDGREGLELFRQREQDIDLVLTDVVMPRMGGGALYQELRAAGKTVPVIFTSGYTGQGQPPSLPIDPSVPFLPKPWTIDEMIQRVRDVLKGSAGA